MNGNRHWLMASAATLGTMMRDRRDRTTRSPTQEPAPPPLRPSEGTEVEAVVVTGTFLRGTPETATIPVEGDNLEAIREPGLARRTSTSSRASREIGSGVRRSQPRRQHGHRRRRPSTCAAWAPAAPSWCSTAAAWREEYSLRRRPLRTTSPPSRTAPSAGSKSSRTAAPRPTAPTPSAGSSTTSPAATSTASKSSASYRYIEDSDGDYNACIAPR